MSERRYGYADRPWEDEPEEPDHEPDHEPDPRPPRWQRTSWRVWTLIAVGMLVLAFGEWNERRSTSVAIDRLLAVHRAGRARCGRL